MTTVVEALQDATHELHEAAALYQARADQVAADRVATIAGAQTIINNYVNRAPYQECFCDFNNGIDAAGRGSLAAPFKTVDYALLQRDRSVVNVINMLTDDTIKVGHTSFASLIIRGVSPAPGPLGLSFSFALRKLSFFGEASNSPTPGLGRRVAGIDMYGGSLGFGFINLHLPTTPAGLDYGYMLNFNGGSFNMSDSSLTVETAGTAAVLISSGGGQRITASFQNTTIGPNAPGKIFRGVAAGQDPRTNFTYETNLASA
ncbi:hypothetical protein [Methylobacterium iners]|uniref:Uncharacterized protein n=1 Tax=Methylobacterium iners TaxID=418707 RepID=A0ABQ4RT36_9HYPH|nr:hypothetical protein [Methylobacterium iners]GJD93352.1 hypothetical protein OCOJLMKI_0545 [Methylobacterium iners]